MSNKKKKNAVPAANREMEIQAAKFFGKHVSKEKARALMAVTLIACALPMVLGVRMWDQIPEIVPTGLIGANGEDDSLPRWAVVFVLPGLMCLLNAICHWKLASFQKKMELPPRVHRLVGRWGFPIISVLFCSGMVFEAMGEDLPLPFVTPCVVGLALMLLGSHMWDCPRDSRIALRFSFTERSDAAWNKVHRFASMVWMAAGLVIVAGAMFTASSTITTAAVTIVALLLPFAYGMTQGSSLN